MKLKSIIHALAYGKSRPSLVRSEGARRVKQAEVMMNIRQTQKTLTYLHRYGSDGKLDVVGVKKRSESAPKTFGVKFGQDIDIVCEGEVDYLKLEQFAKGSAQGYKDIH